MSRRLITLPRPEGGAEHGVVLAIHHNCPAARLYKKEVPDEFGEDIDLVQMAVGLHGYEMPAGVPFEVTSTNPCDACNAYVRGMFQWSTSKLFIP